jgi:hypothetical protein
MNISLIKESVHFGHNMGKLGCFVSIPKNNFHFVKQVTTLENA